MTLHLRLKDSPTWLTLMFGIWLKLNVNVQNIYWSSSTWLFLNWPHFPLHTLSRGRPRPEPRETGLSGMSVGSGLTRWGPEVVACGD